MTVTVNNNPINSTVANGATTVFAYSYQVLDSDDITVAVDGVVQSSGFTVTGVGDASGGTVIFTTAPANGKLVVLYLDPALGRETDYQQFGDWLADEVNRDFDRIWLAIQGANKRIDASLHVSLSDYADGLNTTLPAPAAGTALGWAGDAQSLINIALSTGTGLVDLAASTGSALVGTESYGASATTRSVADKEMDWISVFDYGTFTAAEKADIRTRAATIPVGAKIAASALLINALGAAAFCPAGTYNINDGIAVTTAVGLTLLGAGGFSNNTHFKKTSDGDAVTLTSQTRYIINGITFEGTGMSTGNGLVLDGAGSGAGIIENCQFAHFPGRGLYANFPSGSPASGCDYIRNLVLECGATLGVPNAEFRYSNDSRWEGNQFGGKVGGPYATIGAYHFQCKASDFGPANYHWEHTVCAKYEQCDYSRFTAQRWEEAQTNGVQFVNMIKWNMTGCHIHTNSKASSGTHDGMVLTTCALATISGGNQFYSFSATNVRDCLQIANDCNSIIVADNVFSNFTRRPVTWDRSTFAIMLQGNLPTGYGINQTLPTLNAHYNGLAAGADKFAGIGVSGAAEGECYSIVDQAFLATQCRVLVVPPPAVGESVVVTLVRNSVDTAEVVTVAGPASSGFFQSAVGSEPSLATGNFFHYKLHPSAGLTSCNVSISQTIAA